MMNKWIRSGVLAVFSLGLLAFSGAGNAAPLMDGTSTTDAPCPVQAVTTSHQLTLATRTVGYTATAGFQKLTYQPSVFFAAFNPGNTSAPPADPSPLPQACVFYVYYQSTAPAAQPRPLTFAFNGGPGSASLWLHLGAMGPKRVQMGADGLTPALPYQLADNPDSPLDFTDIVMIDPVGTGFSYAMPGTDSQAFFGAQNDAGSVATFIRDFLDLNKRRESPLYVMGESYGGIRGSLLAQILQLPFYLPLKGLVLVSPALSSTTGNFNEDDNIVPYYTFFPTFASTAWYHKRAAANYLAMSVSAVWTAAQTFANTTLRDALAQGDLLPATEAQNIAQQMSEFTGIPAQTILNLNLRIKDTDFFNDELYDLSEVVGRFDARFTGRRLSGQNGTNSTDPSDTGTGFPFVSAINDYLRGFLNFDPKQAYVDGANIPNWPMNSDSTEFVATHNLSQAFADNPSLQVFVASGYYDLACPMGTVAYERTMIDPASKGTERLTIHPYESGHMVYINPAVLHQLKTDLAQFYGATAYAAPVVVSDAKHPNL